MSDVWHQVRLAPIAAFIALTLAGVAALLGVSTFQAYQTEQAEANWSPFSSHSIEATSDGEMIYFVLSGFKTTTLALNAQVHAFIIGGEVNVVACYRPDGTACAPNPVVSAATAFRSPTLRSIIPTEALSDGNTTFRVCYTYGDRTWCDSIRIADIPIDEAERDGLVVIEPGLSGDPRAISPL